MTSFETYLERAKKKSLELDGREPKCDWKDTPESAGVYAFLRDDRVVRVGRSDNIKKRLSQHKHYSHYSSCYAFKTARNEFLPISQPAGYIKPSRDKLVKQEDFELIFRRHIDELSKCAVKFVEVTDQAEQYILELYASIEYGLSLDEFRNH